MVVESRPPAEDQSLASTYGYAYQFDATLFGPFMRKFGIGIGGKRTEGKDAANEDPHLGEGIEPLRPTLHGSRSAPPASTFASGARATARSLASG